MKAHPALSEEHEAFRDTMRRFVTREIVPHVNAWDEAGEFPREMYPKAAAAGLLGVGFAEEYGGTPADLLMHVVLAEEIALAGSGGVHASLFSHQIGSPPVANAGSAELKARVLPGVLAGEKTFITSGVRADYYTVAVRTGGPGAAGVSLLLIERERPGFSCTPLKKMGWWCSDTPTLHFDHCRVPAANRIGEENQGFRILMTNFNSERLGMAAAAVGYAEACVEDALAWARGRRTFGKRLLEHQAISHKLVEMQTRVHAARALVYDTAWKLTLEPRDKRWVAQLAMTKNFATRVMGFCADEAVQTLGGAGFIRGSRAERIYREVKVMQIGGGAEEIMKDLAARQLGWS